MSLNPGTVNWMDFSHLFVVKNCNVFEKTKINEKEAGVGQKTIVIFYKKQMQLLACHPATG